MKIQIEHTCTSIVADRRCGERNLFRTRKSNVEEVHISGEGRLNELEGGLGNGLKRSREPSASLWERRNKARDYEDMEYGLRYIELATDHMPHAVCVRVARCEPSIVEALGRLAARLGQAHAAAAARRSTRMM